MTEVADLAAARQARAAAALEKPKPITPPTLADAFFGTAKNLEILNQTLAYAASLEARLDLHFARIEELYARVEALEKREQA